MRVLISGIGRSATTLLYQQLAKCLLLKFDHIRFNYEPYLWDLQSPTVNGCSFGMEMISHFGVHVHKSTPLILKGHHPAHDKFIDRLFNSQLRPGEQQEPQAYLTKFIRGAGRLESYIQQYPDVKIVACLRNPIDTINSSLGMFSFLGDEFHKSDKEKLLAAATNFDGFSCESINRSNPSFLELSALWWRLLTESTMDVASRYPENVCLFPLECFKSEQDKTLDKLFDFLPFLSKSSFGIRSSAPAGPKIVNNHLLNCDFETLLPHLDYYLDKALNDWIAQDEKVVIKDDLLVKIAEANYHEPIAGDEIGRSSPVKLRAQILNGFEFPGKYTQPPRDSLEQPENRLPIDSIINEFSHTARLAATVEKKFRPHSRPRNERKTFGCVITCYNNENTILDSLYSALSQTRPYDRIVVVDDGSTDHSVEMIKNFASHYKCVEVVELKHNVGVSVARHLGIKKLATDYITQLDGDDCFWPTKNYHESEVVMRNENAIAFSDILVVGSDWKKLNSTQPYIGSSKKVARKLLSRQQGVPRDMTFARKLYFDAGGYDFRLGLYEDLDFKFRLARCSDAVWRKSDAIAGTIYNRICPAASRNEGLRLPRALTDHFFRYVGQVGLTRDLAAEAYREIVSPFPMEWNECLFDRLTDSSAADIAQMKKILLDRRISNLSDSTYADTITELCGDPAFNSVPVDWQHQYGLADLEGPYNGFGPKPVHWQTAKSCGFSIRSNCSASGVRGLLYLPHLASQKLNVIVEQKGNVVRQSFDLEGRKTDDLGNHVVQKVDIPIPIRPGEAKISCFASSFMDEEERDRELYCLFADWQLYA